MNGNCKNGLKGINNDKRTRSNETEWVLCGKASQMGHPQCRPPYTYRPWETHEKSFQFQ